MSSLPTGPRAAAVAPSKTAPRAFADRVKLVAVAGSVAGFGVVWGLVASNVVGVTARAGVTADANPTGGDPAANQGREGAGFFAGAATQPPAFAGGTGSGAAAGSGSGSAAQGLAGSGSGSGSSGSAGSTTRRRPATVSGFPSFGGSGGLGGPIVMSGSS